MNDNQEQQKFIIKNVPTDQGEKKVAYCPRCGAEVDPNARYCMKCGYLNQNHEENQAMKPYIQENSQTYQVGSGQFLTNEKNGVRTTTATNTGNKALCFFINFGLYLVCLVIAYKKCMAELPFSFDAMSGTSFPIITILITLFFLILYSWQLIFQKCNRRWWVALIPVYNIIVLSKVVYQKSWLGFLCLIPVVNIFYLMALLYELGQKFRKSGFITVLFFYIMIPVIGFGTSFFAGINYVENDKTLERDFLRKRVFLSSFTLVTIFAVLVIIFGNQNTIKQNAQYVKDYYYIYATNQIVKKVKAKVKIDSVACEDITYHKGEGVYYLYFPDVSKRVFLLGAMMRDSISVYVKVDFTSGEEKYYVSMSDGKRGYPETLYEDINVKMIQDYETMDLSFDSKLKCMLAY